MIALGSRMRRHYAGEYCTPCSPSLTIRLSALTQWHKMGALFLNEGSDANGPDDIDDNQPDLPSCLAQLSSTPLLRLTALSIEVGTTARLQLVERILSLGRITHLSITITFHADPIELNRIELAVRQAAGRLKRLGNLNPGFRSSFILSLYPLLGSCDMLNVEFWEERTIPLPSPAQLPSLRTLSVYGVTQESLEELGTFALGRRTPLETLEIDYDVSDCPALEEICESVGTKLVEK